MLIPPPRRHFIQDSFCFDHLLMFSCAQALLTSDGGLQIDEGCVRLATANALLKLAKSQENPVSADVYLQLALTMQASLAASLDCIICTLENFNQTACSCPAQDC